LDATTLLMTEIKELHIYITEFSFTAQSRIILLRKLLNINQWVLIWLTKTSLWPLWILAQTKATTTLALMGIMNASTCGLFGIMWLHQLLGNHSLLETHHDSDFVVYTQPSYLGNLSCKHSTSTSHYLGNHLCKWVKVPSHLMVALLVQQGLRLAYLIMICATSFFALSIHTWRLGEWLTKLWFQRPPFNSH
jgi:hypothetical protein